MLMSRDATLQTPTSVAMDTVAMTTLASHFLSDLVSNRE